MRSVLLAMLLVAGPVLADGKVFAPRNYKGSLEEQSQEAILIYTPGEKEEPAVPDLVLKIGIKGEAKQFGWVVPFPTEPSAIEKADAKLFEELFRYVQSRRADMAQAKKQGGSGAKPKSAADGEPVEVLNRKLVGNYDVATVREKQAGALNDWLKKEGFQPLGDEANDVLGFYRDKQYVFACIKVKDAVTDENKQIDLHPLRFTFKTGRDEGIYFPMKLTGLQSDPFSVNLYVFHRYWIDDSVSDKGYEARGFHRVYRDWDSAACTANGGKDWSEPGNDPFLKSKAGLFPTVTELFQTLHPGKRYYLTQIRGNFKPQDVRAWPDDLWFHTYRVSGMQRSVPWLLGGGVVLALSLVVWVVILKLRSATPAPGAETATQG